MSPLRAKMIRTLELHRLSPETNKAYLAAIEQLARFHNRSPDQLCTEQLRDFLHHLITVKKLAPSTCNQKIAAINFLYRNVLGQVDFYLKIRLKRSGRLPEPLSRTGSSIWSTAKSPSHSGTEPTVTARSNERLERSASLDVFSITSFRNASQGFVTTVISPTAATKRSSNSFAACWAFRLRPRLGQKALRPGWSRSSAMIQAAARVAAGCFRRKSLKVAPPCNGCI